MPPWITQLLIPAIVQIAMAVAIVATVRQQIIEVTRRVGALEQEKLDKDVFEEYKAAIRAGRMR